MRPESDDCSAEQSDDGERRSLDTDLVVVAAVQQRQVRGLAEPDQPRRHPSCAQPRRAAAWRRSDRLRSGSLPSGRTERAAQVCSDAELTWRQKPKKQSECADYQVEHRYSSFRLLRQRILDVVSAPSESDTHPLWCAYCSRVLWLVTAGDFPSRYPSQGPVATYTGWRQLLVRLRKHGLEKFINELLTAAKDVSYRYTAVQCERYATVSGFLNEFLADSHLRTAVSSTALSCC
ncbi:hypothetical protein PR001_g24513 [Phytophthora rubi]|uniref:PX domain-containing protein n=1 Tax=Phytophthora rubi TaxID=129364 RepID=A0A6A3IIP4_9STRA|nr:hypothetical protein PR001_g24513 [Phytophthora rubi]